MFMVDRRSVRGGVMTQPFHARLRERAEHEHVDAYVDLDTGLSEIVPEHTPPENDEWDICVTHLFDGWSIRPYESVAIGDLNCPIGLSLG